MPFGKPTEDIDAWHFPADIEVEQVVDGDTTDLTADLGFQTRRTVRVRLHGIDTAEIYGVPHESDEFMAGKEHMAFVESWVGDARESGLTWPFSVWTLKDTGKYGRYIASIERRDTGEALTDALRVEFPEL